MKRLSSKTPTNVLCLAVDRLNADFLGAYGNTWIESPAFNALASSSVLFDSYYATSLDLRALYRAFWRGESPATFRVDQNASESDAPISLFRALKERGYRTFVVSDVEEITLHEAIDDDYCDGRFFLDVPNAQEPVEALESTRFFRN
ncbi:MAG: sulfatase-like hydrolase/transferase, partial [Thermoguttaceae bacterium]|nr:sulfatase-like hydrolase/transferase [Thermoguttaceae bacterium]